jgi:hypothetical protein
MLELFSQGHELSGNTQYAGVHWIKVVRAPATPQLGLGHAQVAIYELQYVLQ